MTGKEIANNLRNSKAALDNGVRRVWELNDKAKASDKDSLIETFESESYKKENFPIEAFIKRIKKHFGRKDAL